MARRGRGFRRQQRRKFVWDRTFGFFNPGDAGITPNVYGVDLLAGYRSQPGATHLGATVTRIRGYIYPELGSTLASAVVLGTFGFRIDSWNEDPLDVANSPTAQPDEDWLGWEPWLVDGTQAPNQPSVATWNPQASAWAIDIKAQRKLEELNQTLWLFSTAVGGGQALMNYNLSVGLKLP